MLCALEVVQHVVDVAEDMRRACWKSWRSHSMWWMISLNPSGSLENSLLNLIEHLH